MLDEETEGAERADWKWVVGGMAGTAVLVVTLLVGFQSTVDSRQDTQIERIAQRGEEAIRELTTSQRDIARSLEATSRVVERTAERLDTIDRRGSTYLQEHLRGERPSRPIPDDGRETRQ